MCSTNTLDIDALNCRRVELRPVLTTDRKNNWATIYWSAFKYQKSKSPLWCFLCYGLLFFNNLFYSLFPCLFFFSGISAPPSSLLSWVSLTLVALVNVWILSMLLNSPVRPVHPHRLHFSVLEKWLSHMALSPGIPEGVSLSPSCLHQFVEMLAVCGPPEVFVTAHL